MGDQMALSKIKTVPESPAGNASNPYGVEIDDIRAHLFEWQSSGLPCALLTLVNYEGSSPRPVGSQLVVNARGERAGLISGGCIEAALIEEALASLDQTAPRLVRYGKDSDFMDIRLPCGSGIDVFIHPNPSKTVVECLYQAYRNRQPITLCIDIKSVLSNEVSKPSSASADQWLCTSKEKKLQTNQQLGRQEASKITVFPRHYHPRTRIVVIGEGAIFGAFRAMAALFDLELLAYTHAEISQAGFGFPVLDAWTAVVTLSHDHDKEEALLVQALNSEAFHIAALGSRATQAARLARLRQLGCSDSELARIKGPAGLDLGGQTPAEIALSIMAEIVGMKNSKLTVQKC